MTPKTNNSKRTTSKVPAWPSEHFERSVNALQTLARLMHISEKGISGLRGMPRIVKVLSKIKGTSQDSDSQKRLQIAEEEALLAQSEVDLDYPVLHGLAVVALWSELEHFSKGLVALWLLHRKDALSVPAVQKLKIKLSVYLQLTKAEQSSHLVELLEQDLASSLKRGINRFESLFEPFSLNGKVPQDCGQILYELQQIRNVMAHRNGIADRKLKTECPWLKVKVGKQVMVSKDMLNRYFNATFEYITEVFYRVSEEYGVYIRPEQIEGE